MIDFILINTEDLTDTVKEEKQLWLIKVLVALGAREDLLNEDDRRDHLSSIGLEVWSNVKDDSIDIFRYNKLVAQWKTPKLIKVKEGKGKFYYEIHLNEWALPFQIKTRR
jgi:hypothetical protein